MGARRTGGVQGTLKVLLVAGLVLSLGGTGAASAASATYTTDADFDLGTLVGLEHDTVHDQLQLTSSPVALPFLWMPNEDGSVSRLDTVSGREVGRYRVVPATVVGASPSRTTVDLLGRCWLGTRYAGNAVQIGLWELGQWEDRNGNGVCETSRDLNGDGVIGPGEMLPWGQDEAVLCEIVLVPGRLGTYEPGEYPGPYANDPAVPGPRGFAIDRDNNLWLGCYGLSVYYYVDGDTGEILSTLPTPGHWPYGAITDHEGRVWSSGQDGGEILRIDPRVSPPTIERLDLGDWAYGIAMSDQGYLYVSGWTTKRMYKVAVDTMQLVAVWSTPEQAASRGVACTSDGDVWVADASSKVFRYRPDGTLAAIVPFPGVLTGVAVDAAGKVWVCGLGNEAIGRIDPATNAVELVKTIPGSGGHYSYGDMTGLVARTVTTRIGTWTTVRDGGLAAPHWRSVAWNASAPVGTSVTVRVRSSADRVSWSPWAEVSSGAPPAVPDLRYLQIETTLQILSGDTSPVLHDLTVSHNTEPVVAADAAEARVTEGGVATMTGSVTDADGDVVSLTASRGTVTPGPGGTWSWSLVTADGPDESGPVTVVADDGHGGLSSRTFGLVVDNAPPVCGPIAATFDPQRLGTPVTASAAFTDPGPLDAHTGAWDWGDGTTSAATVTGAGGSGSASGTHLYAVPGVYTVRLTVSDDDGASATTVHQYVVVYDPEGGFVTGGGNFISPPGAYAPAPTLAGKATFGFVSKYLKGATVPSGNTEFQFHAAGMDFKSTSYEWLVVAGARAQYKGAGRLDGVGGYRFMLTAIDGQVAGGGGVDRLRMRIWSDATGEVVYDNMPGAGDTADPVTALTAGSIVVHKR